MYHHVYFGVLTFLLGGGGGGGEAKWNINTSTIEIGQFHSKKWIWMLTRETIQRYP